jgi:hypothetical protein
MYIRSRTSNLHNAAYPVHKKRNCVRKKIFFFQIVRFTYVEKKKKKKMCANILSINVKCPVEFTHRGFTYFSPDLSSHSRVLPAGGGHPGYTVPGVCKTLFI